MRRVGRVRLWFWSAFIAAVVAAYVLGIYPRQQILARARERAVLLESRIREDPRFSMIDIRPLTTGGIRVSGKVKFASEEIALRQLLEDASRPGAPAISYGVSFPEESPPYEGYEQDRILLRSTTWNKAQPPLKVSSREAIDAANRLFSSINFVGLTRKRVLAILGDPKTISDYGVAAAATPDSPLKYHFDCGYFGVNFVMKFHRGIVTDVEKHLLE